MADNDFKTPGKKPHPAIFVGVIVGILLILGVALYVSRLNQDFDTAVQQNQAATETASEDGTTPADATVSGAPVSIDVNAALSDRILGNSSAPVKISEHASFTCSHCADFHNETFDKIKKEYIDTGKAYLVFSDFPLNAPAVHASMVARCLPEAKYFDFVHMLFEKQKEWAFEKGYLDFLKEEAGKAGLDEAHFQACVQNTELQSGIVNRMKGVQAQWNINSTPSFVLNNRTTISGAYPYEEFKKAIDTELTGKKSDAPSSAGDSESATPDTAPAAPDEAVTEEGKPAAATEDDTADEPAAAPEAEDEVTPDPVVEEEPEATTTAPAEKETTAPATSEGSGTTKAP